MLALENIHSLLFVPANQEDKLVKALSSSADMVVADFEDAVPAAEKDTARSLAVRTLAAQHDRIRRAVRVNPVGSQAWEADLAAISELDLDALVVPKATPDAIHAVGPGGPPVFALVESAVGLRLSFEIASASRVAALLLGAVDLGFDLGLETRPDGQEVLFARSKLVLDSSAARIRPPFDQAHLDLADADGLETECALARSLGFRGKLCIHPGQLEIVNRAFSPTTAELERARLVSEAYELAEAAGHGAIQVEGMLVDRPVAERARRLLDDAGLSPRDEE